MTTEETELTFVRCSNCRSLIPAIATRCRMCGAQFEKKADAAETAPSADNQNPNRQSRVRQRTISASPEEVDQIKREAFAEDRAEQETPPSLPSFRLGGASRSETVAPAFQGESVRNQSPPPAVEEGEQEYALGEQDLPEHDDDESMATHHRQSPPAPDSFRFVDRVSEQDDDWNEENDLGGEEEEDELSYDLLSDEGDPSASPARGEGRRKRRRRRRKRGTNTGEPVDLQTEASRESLAPVREQGVPAREHVAPQREPQRHEQRETQERPMRPSANFQPQASHPAGEHEARRSESSEASVQAPKTEGKLVGWFVSFGDQANGQSAEIRSGRYFLGRQKLRGNDYLVPHASVSTPHCMIVAGGSDALVIQDLMSETGTQIRRAHESSFNPVTNAVTVQHGDWVRFGQYEVMVCLLPKGRAS